MITENSDITTEDNKSNDEAQIQQLLDDWAKATREGDDDAVLSNHASDVLIYRWNTKLVAHHFCPECGCTTFSDSPAFERDGSWDNTTRRIGVNARLFDGFDVATASVEVIDGKNLW